MSGREWLLLVIVLLSAGAAAASPSPNPSTATRPDVVEHPEGPHVVTYSVGFAPEPADQLVALQRYLVQVATGEVVSGYEERDAL